MSKKSKIQPVTRYIHPQIKFFSTFEDLEKNYSLYGNNFIGTERDKFDGILDFKTNLVIAEPGYGKTRLLKEIVLMCKDSDKEAIFIDIKNLYANSSRISIIKYIENKAKDSNTLKTKKFDLIDSENIVICLDALDEVHRNFFSRAIDDIHKLRNKYKKITLIVSCRIHDFKRQADIISNIGYRFILLRGLSRVQVSEYLREAGLGDAVDEIIDKFQFQYRDLVIQTPRYLEALIKYIEVNGVKDLKDVTKTDLLDFFIYYELDLEEKKSNRDRKELIKRVLEKLALIMEIYQKNTLTKDELLTFFDDLKSDLKSSLLNQIDIEELYAKTILNDNIDTIEFQNTEFQEYLAAKEIVRMGDPNLVIFDLAVEKTIKELYLSWFNTISFVADLDISIVKSILKFTVSEKSSVFIDEENFRFLTKVNVERLSEEDRAYIFEFVFGYYQDILQWIDYSVAKNLPYYFVDSQKKLLKKYSTKKKFSSDRERFTQLGNLTAMISGLLIRGVFTQREEIYWKKRLIDFALDKNKNGVLQRHALEALSYFKDESIIQKLKSLWNSKDEQIQEEFLRLCESINPNSELSIDYFIKGVKGRSIKAMYAMHKVDSKEGVGYFIDCLLKDISLVDPFIDHLSIFDERDSIIFENIYNNWDEDIRKKLESLIVKIFKSKRVYNYNSSRFVISVAELLKRNDGKYTFKLLDKILKDKVLINNFYYFKDIFARIIEKKEVKSLIEKTSKIDTDKRNILWILQLAGDSNRQDGFSIYEEGRKYLKKEYAEIEKNSKKYKRREKSEDKKLYKLFTYKLGPAPKQYITDVFDFYVNNSERLEPFVNEDDKKRLVDLIENTAFKFLDPSKYKLKIQDKTSDRTTYTTNSAISIFGGALLAAENLKLAVKDKYRKAILNYIPFAYDNHLNAIFSLIDDPKPSEIKSVLKVYKDKKSDLWRFMPSSFITACEKYNLIEGVPILKEFVFQENFRLYERVNALKAIYLINPDEAFFKKVFDKYQNIDDSKDVANEANALLIRKYGDKQSTYWRFEQLKKRAFKFIEARGVHAVSDNEDELHSKKFAEPLFSLTDIKYKKDFNLLVKESILLLRKDEEHYKAYVQYLWEITMKYYDGLKVHGTYDPIISLESFLIKITSKDEFGWFGYEIKKLKRSYMEFIGKPSHISTCIRTYNNLKQRQYYEITSTESLAEEVKSALNTELKNWLESSGKKFVEKERETSLQKIIKIKLESIFHKKGFNITIHREVQLESDKRTDFILFYGFIGPLVVEFKLSDNEHLAGKDLKSKESFKNMEHYMKGYESEKGIFLVINNKKEQGRYKFNSHLVKIKNTYEILDGVEVVGIDVLSDSGQ